ncbi:MAG: hypothetical protein DME16_21250 [Candidatus Rokuibacteriota bacterium]|nr:MAG: hypothetical protein DME16_21250 [Candidatus Rokubacteria bacterium]
MEGAVAPTAPSSLLRPGKMFVNPLFDYLLIGGIVSWIAGGIIYGAGVRYNEADLFWVLLVSNWAHFAASTVRLYTKPDAVRTWPFLTLAFPVVTIAVVSAVVALGEPAGRYFFALYFLWSPFHYSAQAFGLSVMYAYRSGTTLAPMDRTLIRWTCLLPFFWTLLQPQGGLGLVLPAGFFAGFPLRAALSWATVFHGLQYLAIVLVFHIKDQERLGVSAHGWLYHAACFYGTCLVLGFVLFQNWPQLYWLAGYDIGRATLLVVAVINIHHFIVDAFIWKLRRDPNYKNVVDVPASVVAV